MPSVCWARSRPNNLSYAAMNVCLQILPCTKVLYFDVPDEVMVERLLHRAKTSGRVDDNEETIKKRLATFHKHSEPVIEYYKDKCAHIVALAAPDQVFTEVEKVLDALQH